MVIPEARINNAIRKKVYDKNKEAGKNKSAPKPATLNPITIPRLYPIFEIIVPAGIEVIK